MSQESMYTSCDPTTDSRVFRKGLGQFATGVSVVTTTRSGEPVGMTINSFSAVSLNPPLVLWCIRQESRKAPAFLEASHFAVNVLSADQVEVSQAFATPEAVWHPATRWQKGRHGLPLLDGALAQFECATYEVYPGGDHKIILGRVERVSFRDGDPLLFVQGGYAVRQDLPARSVSAGSCQGDPRSRAGVCGGETPFTQLLSAASHRLSANFDKHRAELGLTRAKGRILQRLYSGPLDFAELENSTFLSRETLEDSLNELVRHALVTRGDDGKYHLTGDGRRKREEAARRAAEFTEEILKEFNPADIKATRTVLAALARRT
jgi:4-hydroxyphenylacetate 3-hydroxylase, reductase component